RQHSAFVYFRASAGHADRNCADHGGVFKSKAAGIGQKTECYGGPVLRNRPLIDYFEDPVACVADLDAIIADLNTIKNTLRFPLDRKSLFSKHSHKLPEIF